MSLFQMIKGWIQGEEPEKEKRKPMPRELQAPEQAFDERLSELVQTYIKAQEEGDKALLDAISGLVNGLDSAYVDYLRAKGVPNEAIRHKRQWDFNLSMTYPPSGTHVSG